MFKLLSGFTKVIKNELIEINGSSIKGMCVFILNVQEHIMSIFSIIALGHHFKYLKNTKKKVENPNLYLLIIDHVIQKISL